MIVETKDCKVSNRVMGRIFVNVMKLDRLTRFATYAAGVVLQKQDLGAYLGRHGGSLFAHESKFR
ncbi:MAG TPA: hypothetical protein VK635_13095 [Bradyrhizobium sp.]|jgi:hypothetical protein|nr:hypothetical protein [Bradyrhizobium sp.]